MDNGLGLARRNIIFFFVLFSLISFLFLTKFWPREKILIVFNNETKNNFYQIAFYILLINTNRYILHICQWN